MTLEELEFLIEHPWFPEAWVSSYLADRKRQLAVKERAERAAERGIVTMTVGPDGRLHRRLS